MKDLTKTLSPVEATVIAKVTHVLNQHGIKYAIQDSTGAVHGELKPAEAKPKKKAPIYGYGVIKEYLDTHGLDTMQINTHKVIPCGTYDPEVIRRSVCSYASKHWGNKTYKTVVTDKGVEITRFDAATAKFLKEDPLADLFGELEETAPKKGLMESFRLPNNFRMPR